MRSRTLRTLAMPTLLGVAIAAAAGCVSPILADQYDVATKLVPGQTEQLILVLLRDDAEIEVREAFQRPPSGNWGDVVANDQVLGSLLVAESRTGRSVERVMRLERFWGFQGWEIYHLFFDAESRLVGFYRKIL